MHAACNYYMLPPLPFIPSYREQLPLQCSLHVPILPRAASNTVLYPCLSSTAGCNSSLRTQRLKEKAPAMDEGPLWTAKGAAASPVLIRGLDWAPDSAPGRLAGKGRICFAGKAESERVTIDREEWRRCRVTGSGGSRNS
jgi:hypothetical protein